MLLSTKIRPPSLPEHVMPRDSLLAQLSIKGGHKVTSLTEPAGYGKTTLALSWLKSQKDRFVWYGLDKTDNNATSFWVYLIHALKRIQLSIGKKSIPLFNSSKAGDQHAAILLLLEDLDKFQQRYLSAETLYIVLDDFHEIRDSKLLEQINYFLDYLPDNIQFVITSRAVPLLSMAKRSARGELRLIEKDQLRLSLNETQCFLAQRMDISVSEETLQRVVNLSGGWLGALQIMCSSLGSARFLVSDCSQQATHTLSSGMPLISNYIEEEVVNRLTSDSLHLLTQLAPLPRFTIDLLNLIEIDGCDKQDKQGFLQELIDSNLVESTRDNKYTWFTIHALLREWLQARWEQNYRQAIDPKPLIHWFVEHELWSDAFELSIIYQDWQLASRLAISSLTDIIRSGQYYFVRSLLSRFPGNIIERMPKLALFDIWSYLYSVGHDLAYEKLSKIKQLLSALQASDVQRLNQHGINSSEDLFELLDLIAIVEQQISLLSRGPTQDEHTLSRIERYAKTSHPFSNWCWHGLGGNAFLLGRISLAKDYLLTAYQTSKLHKDGLCVLATLGWLGPVLIMKGEMRLAETLCSETEEWCVAQGFDEVGMFSNIARVRALLYREQNQLSLADDQIALIKQNNRFIDPLNKLYNLWAEVAIGLARGDHVTQEVVNELDRFFKRHFKVWHLGIPSPDLVQRIIELQQGNIKPIKAWFKHYKPNNSDSLNVQQLFFEKLVYCRGLIESGGDPSFILWDLKAFSELHGFTLLALKSELLIAIYLYKQNDKSTALKQVLSVIAQANSMQLYRTVLDEADLLQPILCECQVKDSLKLLQPSASWLNFSEDGASDTNEPVNSRTQSIPEYVAALTKREQQILIELSSGLSNQAIGDKLNISITTVKTHVANIYSKLQVKNRTQAVTVARGYGWI